MSSPAGTAPPDGLHRSLEAPGMHDARGFLEGAVTIASLMFQRWQSRRARETAGQPPRARHLHGVAVGDSRGSRV